MLLDAFFEVIIKTKSTFITLCIYMPTCISSPKFFLLALVCQTRVELWFLSRRRRLSLQLKRPQLWQIRHQVKETFPGYHPMLILCLPVEFSSQLIFPTNMRQFIIFIGLFENIISRFPLKHWSSIY